MIPGDLHHPASFQKHFQSFRPDVLVHLAWYAEPGKYLWDQRNVRDMTSSLELFELAQQCGVSRIVGIGSCLEYEASRGYFDECSPLGPQSLYASAKAGLFLVASGWAKQSGVSFAWCRLFYEYGPAEDTRRLVPSIVLGLLDSETVEIRSGNLVRDYLHVDDVAEAIVATAASDYTGAINIGSGRPVFIEDIARCIGRQMNREDLLRFDQTGSGSAGPPFVCANTAQLRNLGSWHPRYSLDQGLAATIDWWRDYRIQSTASHVQSFG